MADRNDKAKFVGDGAPHLLLIDDDSRIRTLLSQFLSENGYRVTAVESADDARRKMEGLEFDLLVLDVMMPGESGLSFAVYLRKYSNVPILLLTARSEIEDRVAGLETGVDDYLAKPFDPRELLLRIGAILKRGALAVSAKPTEVRFGPFKFQVERNELTRGEEVVRLTDREKQLLALFALRPGKTVPRDDIIGADQDHGQRTVDVQINRLRRKIEVDPGNPLYLLTVRGIGYRLVAD